VFGDEIKEKGYIYLNKKENISSKPRDFGWVASILAAFLNLEICTCYIFLKRNSKISSASTFLFNLEPKVWIITMDKGT